MGQVDLFGVPSLPPASRRDVSGQGDSQRAPAAASGRQASFAADIAGALGIPLPVGSDAASVGAFIERHRREFDEAMRRSRGRGGR